MPTIYAITHVDGVETTRFVRSARPLTEEEASMIRSRPSEEDLGRYLNKLDITDIGVESAGGHFSVTEVSRLEGGIMRTTEVGDVTITLMAALGGKFRVTLTANAEPASPLYYGDDYDDAFNVYTTAAKTAKAFS